jgi:hypothetical protein
MRRSKPAHASREDTYSTGRRIIRAPIPRRLGGGTALTDDIRRFSAVRLRSSGSALVTSTFPVVLGHKTFFTCQRTRQRYGPRPGHDVSPILMGWRRGRLNCPGEVSGRSNVRQTHQSIWGRGPELQDLCQYFSVLTAAADEPQQLPI